MHDIWIRYHFLTFFLNVALWSPNGGQWTPFSYVWPSMDQTTIYATAN